MQITAENYDAWRRERPAEYERALAIACRLIWKMLERRPAEVSAAYREATKERREKEKLAA